MGENGTPKTCSKCKNKPVDRPGYPLWCSDCRREYREQYAAGKLDRREAIGFRLGVESFREILVDEFSRLGASGFDGDEAAALIAQAPGPRRPAKEESSD